MAAQANIALTDSLSASHTFTPSGKLNDGKGTLRWVNRNADNPACSEYLTLQSRLSQASGAEVASQGLKVPMNEYSLRMGTFATYVDTTTGLTLPDYPLWAAASFGIPVRAATVDSEDLAIMIAGLIGATIFRNHINGSATIY